jgi:3-oxoacyl-[acyl-carrier-protein] synthase III
MPEAGTRPIPGLARWGSGTRQAAVKAVGIAVPEGVLDNATVASRVGVSEDWIVARTGVRERRVADAETSLVDHAADAAGRALAAAGTHPGEVDLVLVATMSHDSLSPNAAPLVAARIGADRAGAMDVGAACSGFVSALVLAAAQIESGRANRVLVVGADLMTRLVDPADRSTAALFGDGAGAVLLVQGGPGVGAIGPAVLGADGARHDLVSADRAEGILRMKGHDTFRQAVDRLSEATADAVASAGLDLDEIDVFAFHQANTRILAAVGERLGLDPDRVIDCMGRYGNTSAATIPLALAEALDAGMLKPGGQVLVAAFGGGLTWAATVIEWGGGPGGGNGRAA